jgi:hypothetical protein
LEGIKVNLGLFLGFVHYVLQVPVHLISLWHCAVPCHIAMFVAVQRAREAAVSTMQRHVDTLTLVLKWFSATTPKSDIRVGPVQKVKEWLTNNIRRLLPAVGKRKPQIFDINEAPSLPELIAMQVGSGKMPVVACLCSLQQPCTNLYLGAPCLCGR